MTNYDPVTMSATNSRTEFSFWALWSAPLVVSTDIRNMSQSMRSILTNPEIIAVDQDASCTGGDRVRNDTSGAEVWARPLHNGDMAVILFNGAQFRTIENIGVRWEEIGWNPDAPERRGGSGRRRPGRRGTVVRDLWGRTDLGTFEDGFNATHVKPHDLVFLRLSPSPSSYT